MTHKRNVQELEQEAEWLDSASYEPSRADIVKDVLLLSVVVVLGAILGLLLKIIF